MCIRTIPRVVKSAQPETEGERQSKGLELRSVVGLGEEITLYTNSQPESREGGGRKGRA